MSLRIAALRAVFTCCAFACALAEEAAAEGATGTGEEGEKKEGEEEIDPHAAPNPFNVYTLGSWIFSLSFIYVIFKVTVAAKEQFEQEDHDERVKGISPVDGKKIEKED